MRCESTVCRFPAESLFVSAFPAPLGTLTRRYCREHGRKHAAELINNPHVEHWGALSILPQPSIFEEGAA